MDPRRLTRYDPALDVELGKRAYGHALLEDRHTRHPLTPGHLRILITLRIANAWTQAATRFFHHL